MSGWLCCLPTSEHADGWLDASDDALNWSPSWADWCRSLFASKGHIHLPDPPIESIPRPRRRTKSRQASVDLLTKVNIDPSQFQPAHVQDLSLQDLDADASSYARASRSRSYTSSNSSSMPSLTSASTASSSALEPQECAELTIEEEGSAPAEAVSKKAGGLLDWLF
jgi:hypothetical protein